MEKIIFITIIVSASIYIIVRVYYRIKMIIQYSRGKKSFAHPADSCCGCSSCSVSDECKKITI
jgi:hypothetical protein